MKMKLLQLLAASTTLPSAVTFTVPPPYASKIVRTAIAIPSISGPNVAPTRRDFGTSRRKMASDGDGDATTMQSSRPRRKRKDGKKFSPPSQPEIEKESAEVADATEPEPEPEPETPVAPPTPKQNVVVMQVRDIRDVVSGAPEAPIAVEEEEYVDEKSYDEDDDDDELADDEEWEYYDVDEDGNEVITPDDPILARGRSQDDSMEQLLADARQFRSSTETTNEEEESSVRDTIFNVISTIVTVDFFVVLALLAWFLAGIFCSYVLKDDTVQIAFNMNFERLTQPALGLLMVGSVAGSFGNKDEEDE